MNYSFQNIFQCFAPKAGYVNDLKIIAVIFQNETASDISEQRIGSYSLMSDPRTAIRHCIYAIWEAISIPQVH